VRNLADGRVEAWLEGEPGSVAELRAWLEQGPPAARVEQVAAADVAPADHADFEIRPTGHG
jgi:acylphosphatase